jgi:hypothetical protein
MMNCWTCKTELIWAGDQDLENESEDYAVVSHLSCPNCHAHVEFYVPRTED